VKRSLPATPPQRAKPPALARHSRALALALALAAVAYDLTVASAREGGRAGLVGDAHYSYAAARSLAFDGDLDLTNQLQVIGDRWHLGRDPASDGYRLPVRELGPALLMVPGLWLHHNVGLSARWEGPLAVAPASASLGLCFAGCAAALTRLRARLALDLSAATITALALAATLGFVAPFYALGPAGYAHAPEAAAIAWLAASLLAEAPRAAGLSLAIALLMRLQSALWLICPLTDRHHDPARRLLDAGRIALLGALALLPLIYLGLAHPGSARGPIRWGLGFFRPDNLIPGLGAVLFGPHGLFTATPLAALGVLGLAVAPAVSPRQRPIARGFGLVVLAQVMLCAMARDPDGGAAYGARRLAGLTVVIAIGLGLAYARLPARARLICAALIAALVAINLARTELALRGLIPLTIR
jgi:hypothetical protein